MTKIFLLFYVFFLFSMQSNGQNTEETKKTFVRTIKALKYVLEGTRKHMEIIEQFPLLIVFKDSTCFSFEEPPMNYKESYNPTKADIDSLMKTLKKNHKIQDTTSVLQVFAYKNIRNEIYFVTFEILEKDITYGTLPDIVRHPCNCPGYIRASYQYTNPHPCIGNPLLNYVEKIGWKICEECRYQR